MSPERALAVARALRNRLHWGLHSGSMRAGDRFPSVRAIASEFDVDTRTALRACRLLADEGLIEMRKRSGMYVSLPASLPPRLSATQQSVADIFAHGLALGIHPSRLPDLLREHSSGRRVRVACIESNADHAEAIGAVIRDTFGVDAFSAGMDEVLDDAPTALAGVNAVVTTAFHATDVRRAAEALGLPVFVATPDPILGHEFMRMLADRPVYVIGTDRRWSQRMREVFENTNVGPNLHVCVAGEDDCEHIPLNAEVFVMPAAGRWLAASPIRDRARLLRYTLSEVGARGLISTIVAANGAA